MPRLSIIFLLYFYLISPLHADDISNSLGMKFTEIPAGNFMMGTSEEALAETQAPRSDIEDEAPAHPVVISQSFYLGKTEVTQEQWLSLMKTKPGPSNNWQRKAWKNLPVVGVSWNMANDFIAALNKQDKQHQYRLPTEAEWEYAARAGTKESRAWAEDEIDDYAWFIYNSNDMTQPVATKQPNDFGLYDTLGNAWEWTADWYTRYTKTKKVDPKGPELGSKRARRGGSFHCSFHRTSVAFRGLDTPDTAYSVLGFRVAMDKLVTSK